jgi:DNA-binding LacI/PurR family transcriptional regulator/biotin operon repressor
MDEFRVFSASEQVAEFLRQRLRRGVWSETMPGGERLSRELGVGRMTIEAALAQLEQEGWLVPQGVGRRRKITVRDDDATPALRIRLLNYQQSDELSYYIVDLLHRLRMAGHEAEIVSRSLLDLKLDPVQVQRLVEGTRADAWVIGSGSRLILEWFAGQEKPAFALFGRRHHLRIAGGGPDKFEAQRQLVQRLVELGHRRIVILARKDRREPHPAAFEQAFLDRLRDHGISTGLYNLPDWDESPGGLQQQLDSLFAHTPPTALFIEEMPLFIAAQQHLAIRGFLAPRDVSLICDDPDPAFSWCQPSISHIHWDARPLVRRILKWSDNVARGKDDRRQTSIKAEFVEGGTIGPAPKQR